jgi:hypothetical protein
MSIVLLRRIGLLARPAHRSHRPAEVARARLGQGLSLELELGPSTLEHYARAPQTTRDWLRAPIELALITLDLWATENTIYVNNSTRISPSGIT